MKRKALALCLLLLLLAPIALFSGFDLVLGNPEPSWPIDSFSGSLPLIYIRSDGSVEGTDMIQRKGDVYTFVGDIGDEVVWARGIVVERDNIVIDGSGHALRGHGDFSTWYFDCDGKMQPRPKPPGIDMFTPYPEEITGLSINGKSNVTIKNLKIQSFWVAINIMNCISVNIEANILVNNTRSSVEFVNSSNINLIDNNVQGSDYGLIIKYSECILSKNIITKNAVGLTIDGSNNIIFGNQITHNYNDAIRLYSGTNNCILNNNLADNDDFGICIHCSGNYVSKNLILNNNGAIMIRGENNTFCENQIVNNYNAVELFEGVNNTFYCNTFTNNTKQIRVSFWFEKDENVLDNFWDKDKKGNYWSDYNGSDWDWDGIGDTPYYLSAIYLEFVRHNQYREIVIDCGQDNFPLMSPVEFSGGYADLPLWAYEKLVSLNLLEDSAAQSDTLPAVTVEDAAIVSLIIGVVVVAGLLLHFKKRNR